MRRAKFKSVIIEIIQNVTILLSNISQKANLNYVLSNPALNEFIIYYHDFTDEEFVDYYVSMLKSISLRMDDENISLFFNERLSYFPVLWQAARFYNHREAMVRTAIRTVILGVMKIDYPLAK
jgi:protein CLEC16A